MAELMIGPTTALLTVLEPGLTSVQDLGRAGGPRVGQMTGGALDQYAAAMANTLVGSDPEAPLLELVAMDFAAVVDVDLLVAVTGAEADVTVDGCARPQWEPIAWPAGTRLAIRGIRSGLRVYLAVHGALATPRLLGSCAPDTVLGFGQPLVAGEVRTIAVDCPPLVQPWFDIPFFRLGARPHPRTDLHEIDLTEGPDALEFGETATRLTEAEFVVGPQSNHIGLRLGRPDGGPLPRRASTAEILSRGVPIGAVEVPAGDELLILHRGRGVTAGYPVLAVVTAVGLSRLGQARPGDRVRFRRVSRAAAVAAHRCQRAHLADVRARVAVAFAGVGIPLHVTTYTPLTSAPSVPELKESA